MTAWTLTSNTSGLSLMELWWVLRYSATLSSVITAGSSSTLLYKLLLVPVSMTLLRYTCQPLGEKFSFDSVLEGLVTWIVSLSYRSCEYFLIDVVFYLLGIRWLGYSKNPEPFSPNQSLLGENSPDDGDTKSRVTCLFLMLWSWGWSSPVALSPNHFPLGLKSKFWLRVEGRSRETGGLIRWRPGGLGSWCFLFFLSTMSWGSRPSNDRCCFCCWDLLIISW